MATTSQWIRYVSLQVGSLLITSDQLDIEFEIKGSNKSDANTAEISVFNLARKTRESIKPDQAVLLKAGYVGDAGNIFVGYVKLVSELRDGENLKTKISVLTKGCVSGRQTKKYPIKTPLKTLVEAAFKDSQIPAQCTDGCQGFTLDAEYTSDPSAAADLEYCAKLINGSEKAHKTAKYYVEAAGGYFVTQGYVRGSETVILSSETGLIESLPEDPDDKTYTRSIRSGLCYRIGVDTHIELKSRVSGASGTYKVVEYIHKYEGEEFETECKVQPV